MASTGEVGCLGEMTSEAVMKSMLSVGQRIPTKGVLLSSGTAKHKAAMLEAARMLDRRGFRLYATEGTHRFLQENGIASTQVFKPSEPDRQPQALDILHNHDVDLVVNIPRDLSSDELSNGYKIRRAAIDLNIPLLTNARLASAFIRAFTSLSTDSVEIKAWDEY